MVQSRLLDIAIGEFGTKGLEGASTRGIAAAAGTAMSSITYHYGGKEGLYLAAAERIADLMIERMGDLVETIAGIAADDPAGARAGVVALLDRIADTMASPDTAGWTLFIVREQMNPTAAFDAIHARAMGGMLRHLARLVGIACGVDAPTARIATVTLVGQPLVLKSSRAMSLRLLDIPAFGDDEMTAIKARIAANTHAILDRLIAEQQEQP